jgi:hypothetical protein
MKRFFLVKPFLHKKMIKKSFVYRCLKREHCFWRRERKNPCRAGAEKDNSKIARVEK